MPSLRQLAAPGENALLTHLPAAERDALLPLLSPVPLELRRVMQRIDEPLTHVWFPLNGVCSMVSGMENGATVEVATVGREGMVGIPLLLGSARSMHEIFVQVAGDALQMPADALREQLDRLPGLRTVALRYALGLIAQISQGSACNRLHPLEARCARWLLMTHDRVAADSFALTQEFLGQMLGVTRPSVSVAAGMLQKAGLIRYTRGVVTILDRDRLEASSCECYGIITGEMIRLVRDRIG